MDFNSIRAACFLSTAVMEFGKAQVALANYPVHVSERSSIFNGTCPRVVGVCLHPACEAQIPTGSNTEEQVPALKAQPNTKHTVKTLLRIG